MINATFWSFSKRKNSTSKPATEGVDIEVLWKANTSVLHPSIELSLQDNVTFPYNYMLMAGRYYYINNATSIANGVWTLECDVDVLTTWIDDVRGQSVYAVMSSYNYSPLIDDSRIVPIPAAYGVTVSSQAMSIFGPPNTILSISGDCSTMLSGNINGTAIFFGESPARQFMAECSKKDFWESLADTLTNFNPMEFFNGIWLTPLQANECHVWNSQGVCKIGDVEISGNHLADTNVKTHTASIPIPKPSYSDFRNSSRFVQYYLYVPFCGVKTIPCELMYGADNLTLEYGGEVLSGGFVALAKIRGITVATFSASLKAQLPMRTQSNDNAQIAEGALKIGVGALEAFGSGGSLGGGDIVNGAVTAVKGIYAASGGDTYGIAGSIAALGLSDASKQNALLACVEYASNVEPSIYTALSGRPSHKIIAIADGYIQSANASVSFAGLSEEIDTFNAYLNGGVYIG